MRLFTLTFITAGLLIISSCKTKDISDTMYVDGRFLYDRAGEKVVLRGINKMTVWSDLDESEFEEMAKTGANVVRICWVVDEWAGYDDFDNVIQKCIDNQMIPMVELHSATGDWERLPEMVGWWVRDSVLMIIKKHEAYLLVNIANECGRKEVTDSMFIEGYGRTIDRMRRAGIKPPLIIDGTDWGKDINILQACGSTLIERDSLKNLMFSVHMWWPSEWFGPVEDIQQRVVKELQESVDMHLPLLVGEFSLYGPGCVLEIPYKTILNECDKHDIGWMAWSWGSGNSDCDLMDMTSDDTLKTVRRGSWGHEVVYGINGLRNTSIRPQSVQSNTKNKLLKHIRLSKYHLEPAFSPKHTEAVYKKG